MESLRSVLVALASLILVLDHVLLLQLSHALNLVQINDEACVVRVVQLDALSTKNGKVVRTVEVLDSLWMLRAQVFSELLIFFRFKVETGLSENWILLDHLIQNVDVQWKPFGTVELLNQFPADGASNTVLMVQLVDAVGAQCMSAMDEDARYPFADVVL